MTRTQANALADAIIRLIDARVDQICRESVRDGVYYPRKMINGDDHHQARRIIVDTLISFS